MLFGLAREVPIKRWESDRRHSKRLQKQNWLALL
jgi:hypothetical protein